MLNNKNRKHKRMRPRERPCKVLIRSLTESVWKLIYRKVQLNNNVVDMLASQIYGFPLNLEKYKQVLHYIISIVENRENVGKTGLFKMLYFSDFDFYEQHENSITGELYRKISKGPAPCNFGSIAKMLKAERKIRVTRRNYWGRIQHRYVSLKEPSTDLLSEAELKTIKAATQKLLKMNATKTSAYSHEDIPWRATADKEIIDYELVFYRSPEFSTRTYPDQIA